MEIAPRFPAVAPGIPTRPTVVVVGATGLVGEVLLEVLEARAFPVGALRALAGPSAQERRVTFRGRSLPVEPARAEAFEGADLVFFAATGELSRELGPEAVRRGARVVDKSSTWRLEPGVPLVVPEINGDAVHAEAGLVACPNCTTIGLVMALAPLQRAAGLERVVVTTLQAASGAGRAGLDELERAGEPCVFPAKLAGNVVPQCGALDEEGRSEEERRLLHETRRILGLPALELAATCVRVPVAVGHGASLCVRLQRPMSVEEAVEVLGAFPGVRCTELGTPVEAAGGDEVLVARVRALAENELLLWQAADNLRKGAATNAVQIAERWWPRR